MVRVLTVGPNAGLQKVLTFPTLEVGGVNRASHVTSYCGGKGQGAALALNIWEPGTAAVASPVGGSPTGVGHRRERGAPGLGAPQYSTLLVERWSSCCRQCA